MIYQEFLASISSPVLRGVAQHWNEARGLRMMPAWESLKPSAITGALSMIWVFKYDRDTGEFTGRLAGERISRGFDRNFRGVPLKELHSAESFPRIYDNVLRLVQEPALAHSQGTLFRQCDRLGIGERITLPLSSDGVTCDGMIGASEYVFPVANHGYGPVEVLVDGERHFSLRQPLAA